MNTKLLEYLERCKKIELKYMYSLDIDDECFGFPTDKYTWITKTLNYDISIEQLIEYFEQHYGDFEQSFIEKLKELK